MADYRSYRHAVRFLESVLSLEASRRLSKVDARAPGGAVGLKRCRRLLARLGNPEQGLRFVHVAGTSGKGSVAHLIHQILHASGIRVGTYMSPHVTSTLERVWVGPGFVPLEAFVASVDALKPVVEAEYREGPYGVPSYHELVMAAALLAFRRLECEVAVMEVGIGGRLDSTNIIPPPEAAVVTDVGLDHTELLGGDVASIARDKSGIIKPGTTVITAATRPAALREIQAAARSHGVPIQVLGDQIQVSTRDSLVDIQTPAGTITGLQPAAPGAHQRRNTALAVATVLSMQQRGWPISQAAVHTGVARAFLPGRFEEIPLQGGGVVVLDIAHNVDKVAAAVQTWMSRHGTEGCVVSSVASNKDRAGILEGLRRGFRNLVVTRPLASHRSMVSPLTLLDEARPMFERVGFRLDPWDALFEALDLGAGRVLVTGSTYLVSEIRAYWVTEKEMVQRGRPEPIAGPGITDRAERGGRRRAETASLERRP